MKHIKTFNESKSHGEIEQILRTLGIAAQNYIITPEGKVDVRGDVNLRRFTEYKLESLKKLPIQFGRVAGSFICPQSLTTLEGCPEWVSNDFDCSTTSIKSLQGSPKYVGFGFDCSGTAIKNLEGGPSEVGGDFGCHSTLLTSLQGAPQTVGGRFTCFSSNLRDLSGSPREVGLEFGVCLSGFLTSLEGAPLRCEKIFLLELPNLKSLVGMTQDVLNINIHSCGLTTLEGCPESISGDFQLRDLEELKDLYGSPKFVGGDLQCHRLQISTLDGMPQIVKNIRLWDNYELKDPSQIRDVEFETCDISECPIIQFQHIFGTIKNFKDSLDYNYFVKDGDEIVILKWKFEEALAELDRSVPKFIEGYRYV